jgi:ferredoxin
VKKPVVDQDMCTGCGLCPDIAPGTFDMNDDGLAEVVDPQGDDEDTIQEAIDSCPVGAISWEE